MVRTAGPVDNKNDFSDLGNTMDLPAALRLKRTVQALGNARMKIYIAAFGALLAMGALAGEEPERIMTAYLLAVPLGVLLSSTCAGLLADSRESLHRSMRGGVAIAMISPLIMLFWNGSFSGINIYEILKIVTLGIIASPTGLYAGHGLSRITGLWNRFQDIKSEASEPGVFVDN